MKRKCRLLIESKDNKRAIFIDVENSIEILNFINQNKRIKKKFLFIVDLILSGFRNTDLYDKEEINSKCKGVTAFKLFKGQENARLYCKEFTSEHQVFVVVIIEVLEKKKSHKINKRLINILEKIGS